MPLDHWPDLTPNPILAQNSLKTKRALTHLASVEHHLLYVPESHGPGVRVPPDTRAEAAHARHLFEKLTHRDHWCHVEIRKIKKNFQISELSHARMHILHARNKRQLMRTITSSSTNDVKWQWLTMNNYWWVIHSSKAMRRIWYTPLAYMH